jgi:hypothetical protein
MRKMPTGEPFLKAIRPLPRTLFPLVMAPFFPIAAGLEAEAFAKAGNGGTSGRSATGEKSLAPPPHDCTVDEKSGQVLAGDLRNPIEFAAYWAFSATSAKGTGRQRGSPGIRPDKVP